MSVEMLIMNERTERLAKQIADLKKIIKISGNTPRLEKDLKIKIAQYRRVTEDIYINEDKE